MANVAHERTECPDCAAGIGEAHRPGCDVERCSTCLSQRLGCDCSEHDPEASVWQGEWPGTSEAIERGWWAVLIPGKGWTPCTEDTPGAIPDLNRLACFNADGDDTLYSADLN